MSGVNNTCICGHVVSQYYVWESWGSIVVHMRDKMRVWFRLKYSDRERGGTLLFPNLLFRNLF